MYSGTTLFVAITNCQITCCRLSFSHKIGSARIADATANLPRDQAESMVPSIDPEQVRKLAGWGLTQNDIASFVGCSRSLISLGF